MKEYDKNKESLNLSYWDINNLSGWAMSQKLPVNGMVFKWVKETSRFNEDLIKSYNEDSDIGYFLEVNLEKLVNLRNKLPFLPERMKIAKVEKLVANFHDKKNML